jgi:hypothetical protein
MAHQAAPPILRAELWRRWLALACDLGLPAGEPGDLWRAAFLRTGNDSGPWLGRQVDAILDRRCGMTRQRLPAVLAAETINGAIVLIVNPAGARLDGLRDLVARLQEDARAARDARMVADSYACGLPLRRTAARWGISERQLQTLRARHRCGPGGVQNGADSVTPTLPIPAVL